MNHRDLLVLGVAAAVVIASDAHASRTGALAGLNGSFASGGDSCVMCHSDKVGVGSVQILGAPASYEFGRIYDLIVRVQDDQQLGGGFQISVEDAGGDHQGDLIISDPVNTDNSPGQQGWVTHTATGADNAAANWAALGNAAEFNVQWQAPATDQGPLTFFAAGNATNENFNFLGDFVYLTSLTAQPPGAGTCPADVTGDDMVAVEDLVEVILAWGVCPPECPADVNDDGIVAVEDLVEVILAWGPC